MKKHDVEDHMFLGCLLLDRNPFSAFIEKVRTYFCNYRKKKIPEIYKYKLYLKTMTLD